MRLAIWDINQDVVDEARRQSAERGIATIESFRGSAFAAPADAIVSPGNSFGNMGGGFDRICRDRFGFDLQFKLQNTIRQRPMLELLVGEAVILATGDEKFPHFISVPTMRTPGRVKDPADIYLASRAAILAAKDAGFGRICMTGLGTGSGGISAKQSIEMIIAGYTSVFPSPSTWGVDRMQPSA